MRRSLFFMLWCTIISVVSTFNSDAQVIRDIVGHKGDSFTARDFEVLFGQATTKVDKTSQLKLKDGTLKGIDSKEKIDVNGALNAWRLVLTKWINTGGDEVQIGKGIAVVANYGNRFEYLFLTPEIPPVNLEDVKDRTGDAQHDLEKEYKDIDVSFGKAENRIQVTAIYSYAGGTSSGKIKARLVHLMNASRDLISATLKATRDAKKDFRKRIEKGKPTSIPADEFPWYFDFDLAKYRREQDKAPEGGWNFTWKDISVHVWNYGDHFEMASIIPLFRYTSDATLQTIKSEAVNWALDHLPKGATGAHVADNYYEPTTRELVIEYQLDGNKSGEDIKGYTKDFLNKYLKKAWKMADELTDKYEESPLDLPAKNYDAELFNIVTDDGLEDLWKKSDKAKEGMYEFDYQDISYELYLYGDRVVLSIYVEMPEMGDDARNNWTEKMKQWANANPADGAESMEVLRYPEYEHLLWIKASYTLDGSYDGNEFARRYHAFVEDYGKQAVDQAKAIFKQ